MALFSRRKKSDSDDASVDRPDTTIEPGEQPVDPTGPSDAAPAADTTPEAPDAATPTVGISMSSFRGVGAGPEPAPSLTNAPPVAARPSARQPGPMEAPEAPETVQGLRDNALLGNALAEITGQPEPAQLLNVARQFLQGHVFLRVKGDARALLAEGKDLPLAVANRGDEQLVLAYSGGLALRASVEADGDHDTSAMGQPVMALLRHVLSGPYAGIVLDPASGDNRAVLPKALLERMVAEVDPELRIKTALCDARTDETVPAIVDAIIAEAPMWIAVNRTEEGGPIGVAESRSAAGERFLEVFSHPLELLALGRGDQPLPISRAQLSKALASDPALTGILVDPAGPWIRLTREQLAPVIDLAEKDAAAAES
ncbi:SseB protein N-terminal domain-containing protein [Microbacterium sp. ru370.1]|uniref:SseB family protein n=1 Tax=unclassified Microbacterium TaxID=2609290 RepID=UPI000882A46B|nr:MULTISPECIES: SseB family protein [unclassified Microbacterium]SDO48515.1 SseB protein N-terminal domain-containing protein [Microbacterium sp. ru370.1]SIT82466.1 SseB protein N-terminal domain-containing protein [Microbacterium sp. RU1D]